MFLSWNGFVKQLTQIFRDPEAVTTAKKKL